MEEARDVFGRGGTRVIVTLPDGKREGFTFYGAPGTQFFGQVFDWIPKFIPDYGVTDELFTDQPRLIKTSNGEYLDTESNHAYNPADAAFGGAYTLKMRNGVELAINAETGELSSPTDLVGNQLEFTGDGIHASNTHNPGAPGRKVDFEYDWAGRISAVVDPAGKRIEYGYDGNGDLVSVTDRMGATTTFTYRDDADHILDESIDPLGVSAARTEYDAEGRVSKVTDAAGKTIEYHYNTTTLVQTVTDQMGYVTMLTLNSNGDTIREEYPDGGITKRTFDGLHHVLTETIVVGEEDSVEDGEHNDLTTTNTYDDKGNLTSTTDPRGNVTSTSYNQYGQPTSVTDALGKTKRVSSISI